MMALSLFAAIKSVFPSALLFRRLVYGSNTKIPTHSFFFALIMPSTCLNGQTGPSAMLAGYGTMGACMAGFGELTG